MAPEYCQQGSEHQNGGTRKLSPVGLRCPGLGAAVPALFRGQ